jgi:tRNA threonylcarbamoyladenosine biosynthesis protein TsaE
VIRQALRLTVDDLEGTLLVGHTMGARLFPGAVIGLIGPLGAGKTQLVRAIAEGLGIRNSRVVSSPTFVLIQEYDARLPIYHFDAYRLPGEREFLDLGVNEYFEGQGVCLVEWADRVPNCLPAERLDIQIEVTGAKSRIFNIEANGEKYVSLVTGIIRPS